VFAQARGRWTPWRIGTPAQERGFALAAWIGLVWLVIETVNIAWPWAELASVGAGAVEIWSVVWVFGGIALIALFAIWRWRPHRAIAVPGMRPTLPRSE